MKLTLALLLLASCATVSAQRWCEGFCGDREATADETSTHGGAVASCACRAPIKEQFDADVEQSMSPSQHRSRP